jgi:F-type H+-transporting ATPase subunit epsilon
MAKATFHLSVITPERSVLDCEARFAAFPGHDGEVGILPGRAPLLFRMGAGRLKVLTEDRSAKLLFVDGGFAQMIGDRLTLLTEQAMTPSEIDRDEARALLAQAAKLSPLDEDAERQRARATQRGFAELRVAGDR